MTDEERIPKPARPLDWLWPVDRAHLLYLLGTTILLIVHRTKAPGAHAWIVVNLVLLIALIVIVRRWTELASGSKARMVFTLAVIPIVFTQLGSLVPYVTSKGQEQALFDLDLWLCFGTNPVEATQHLANPWLTEVLQWVYDFYFFITLILGAAILRRGREIDLARINHAFVTCVYLSYVGYYLVPARGPNIDPLGLYSFDGPMPGVFLATELRETIFLIEKIKQDCFPSGHTAVSLLALTLAYRFARGVVPLLWPLVCALIFSTVYLRYHYLTDVLAGIVLALGTHWYALRRHRSFETRTWGWHGQPS